MGGHRKERVKKRGVTEGEGKKGKGRGERFGMEG